MLTAKRAATTTTKAARSPAQPLESCLVGQGRQEAVCSEPGEQLSHDLSPPLPLMHPPFFFAFLSFSRNPRHHRCVVTHIFLFLCVFVLTLENKKMNADVDGQQQQPHEAPSCSSGATPTPIQCLHQAQDVSPALRQRTISFHPTGSASTTEQEQQQQQELTLHLSIRCFVDYILLFVTEDATCAPGVVLRYDAPLLGPGAFMYEGETPSLDVTVLLGLRDHPLTNMLASSIAHHIRRYGESRPLLMGLSVVQTAKKLLNAAAKKEFLAFIASQLLELAGEGRARS